MSGGCAPEIETKETIAEVDPLNQPEKNELQKAIVQKEVALSAVTARMKAETQKSERLQSHLYALRQQKDASDRNFLKYQQQLEKKLQEKEIEIQNVLRERAVLTENIKTLSNSNVQNLFNTVDIFVKKVDSIEKLMEETQMFVNGNSSITMAGQFVQIDFVTPIIFGGSFSDGHVTKDFLIFCSDRSVLSLEPAQQVLVNLTNKEHEVVFPLVNFEYSAEKGFVSELRDEQATKSGPAETRYFTMYYYIEKQFALYMADQFSSRGVKVDGFIVSKPDSPYGDAAPIPDQPFRPDFQEVIKTFLQ